MMNLRHPGNSVKKIIGRDYAASQMRISGIKIISAAVYLGYEFIIDMQRSYFDERRRI